MLKTIAVCLLLSLVLALPGCTSGQPWGDLDVDPVHVGEPGAPAMLVEGGTWSGQVTAAGRGLPPVPNAMLQLPVVSPDGRWIAFQVLEAGASPPLPDAMLTGRGLERVHLHLREIDAEGPGLRIATAAGWANWSQDGSQLVFISYDEAGRCFLGLHDLREGKTLRKAVGLRRMMMPAMSPDGQRVAVSAYGELPDRAVLFVIDLATSEAAPGPPSEGPRAQILPVWLDGGSLLFAELSNEGPRLKAWRVGDDLAATLEKLVGPISVYDAQHLLAGVPRPVRPGGTMYAYNRLTEGRIALADLGTEAEVELPPGNVAGAWWGRGWFVAGGETSLRLWTVPQAADGVEAAKLHSLRLLDGRWAPRWADISRQSMVLVGEGEPGQFKLMQLWLVAREE